MAASTSSLALVTSSCDCLYRSEASVSYRLAASIKLAAAVSSRDDKPVIERPGVERDSDEIFGVDSDELQLLTFLAGGGAIASDMPVSIYLLIIISDPTLLFAFAWPMTSIQFTYSQRDHAGCAFGLVSVSTAMYACGMVRDDVRVTGTVD
jgi:hypothetical protein